MMAVKKVAKLVTVFCGKVEEDRAHDGWTRLEEAEGSIKVVGIVVHIVGKNSSTLEGGLGMQFVLVVKSGELDEHVSGEDEV